MLIIWGSKHNSQFLGPVHYACPTCGQSPCGLFLVKEKFTLYYVPTFTMGKKYILKCGHCQKQWQIDAATANQLQLHPAPQGAPQAGSPGPGVPTATMNYPGPAATAGGEARICPQCQQQTAPGNFCSVCGAPMSSQ